MLVMHGPSLRCVRMKECTDSSLCSTIPWTNILTDAFRPLIGRNSHLCAGRQEGVQEDGEVASWVAHLVECAQLPAHAQGEGGRSGPGVREGVQALVWEGRE